MLHYICSIEVLTLLIGSVLSPPINSLSVRCAHVHRYRERNDFNQFRRAMNNGDRRVNSSYHACFQLIKSPDFSCYPWHAFKRITRHIYIYIPLPTRDNFLREVEKRRPVSRMRQIPLPISIWDENFVPILSFVPVVM